MKIENKNMEEISKSFDEAVRCIIEALRFHPNSSPVLFIVKDKELGIKFDSCVEVELREFVSLELEDEDLNNAIVYNIDESSWGSDINWDDMEDENVDSLVDDIFTTFFDEYLKDAELTFSEENKEVDEIYLDPKPIPKLKIPFVVMPLNDSDEVTMKEVIFVLCQKYKDVPELDCKMFVSEKLMNARHNWRKAFRNLEEICAVCFVYPKGKEYSKEYMEQLVEEKLEGAHLNVFPSTL